MNYSDWIWQAITFLGSILWAGAWAMAFMGMDKYREDRKEEDRRWEELVKWNKECEQRTKLNPRK